MCCGAADGAGVLLTFGQDAGNHGGRGQAEAEPHGKRNRPGDADHPEGTGTHQAGQHEVGGRKAQQVPAAFLQLPHGDMHADVKQQEDDTQFGEQMSCLALMDQAEPVLPDQYTNDQVAHNRAEPGCFRDEGRGCAEPQQRDRRDERIDSLHRCELGCHAIVSFRPVWLWGAPLYAIDRKGLG